MPNSGAVEVAIDLSDLSLYAFCLVRIILLVIFSRASPDQSSKLKMTSTAFGYLLSFIMLENLSKTAS